MLCKQSNDLVRDAVAGWRFGGSCAVIPCTQAASILYPLKRQINDALTIPAPKRAGILRSILHYRWHQYGVDRMNDVVVSENIGLQYDRLIDLITTGAIDYDN
jgi:hypothetical protein